MNTDHGKIGQPKAVRDTRGNIVVDPAGNIMRSKYLLDYKIYAALHEYKKKLEHQHGKKNTKVEDMRISKRLT